MSTHNMWETPSVCDVTDRGCFYDPYFRTVFMKTANDIDMGHRNRYDLLGDKSCILKQVDTDGGENGKRICNGASIDSA